mgnify:CR=1 FL=1
MSLEHYGVISYDIRKDVFSHPPAKVHLFFSHIQFSDFSTDIIYDSALYAPNSL